jgi:hypothetical protein
MVNHRRPPILIIGRGVHLAKCPCRQLVNASSDVLDESARHFGHGLGRGSCLTHMESIWIARVPLDYFGSCRRGASLSMVPPDLSVDKLAAVSELLTSSAPARGNGALSAGRPHSRARSRGRRPAPWAPRPDGSRAARGGRSPPPPRPPGHCPIGKKAALAGGAEALAEGPEGPPPHDCHRWDLVDSVNNLSTEKRHWLARCAGGRGGAGASGR